MSLSIRSSISFYNRVSNIGSKDIMPLDIFLEYIGDGKWEDVTHAIRRCTDKEEKERLKKAAPSVTVSGTFTERTDNGLQEHSGYIAVDIDKLDNPETLKAVLTKDKYVAACFVSIGGKGLCVLFKINPEKHREAFQGISEYLFSTYEIICDPTSINVSRPRFVSYDPHIHIADKVEKFAIYPKEKPPKKIAKIVFSGSDFDYILQQIVSKRLNITQDSYHTWYRICFAVGHKFGEAGRQYFHIISQYSSKYDANICDKQYTACLKHHENHGSANGIDIATFYYYCKGAGLEIYSERTMKIAFSASQGKKAGLSVQSIEENLKKFEEVEGEDVADIIKQVMDGNIQIDADNLIEQLELWIRQNYSLQRNEITRYIENNGVPLQKADLNSIFIKAKKILDKLTFELVDRLINSDFVPTYNPFKVWFAEHVTSSEEGAIPELKSLLCVYPKGNFDPKNTPIPALTALFSTIKTKSSEFALYFGIRWFTGVVHSIYGGHNPLMYVLSGEIQNTGKTEWWRRLLPPELKPYYAESKLDAGKDDEILMTQKLIIMDDEMGGKSKREEKRLKELTSKQVFSLREPYGHNNVDLVRLANLGGTGNDGGLLSDPTGNRRIVPVKVFGIDIDAYNAIDKRRLLIEAYMLYKAGFKWQLDREDIKYLGHDTEEFEVAVSEAELLMKYFCTGTAELTATDIKIILEKHTQQKLSLDRIGKELKRLGYEQKHIKIGSSTKRVYLVKCLLNNNELTPPKPSEDEEEDNLPF